MEWEEHKKKKREELELKKQELKNKKRLFTLAQDRKQTVNLEKRERKKRKLESREWEQSKQLQQHHKNEIEKDKKAIQQLLSPELQKELGLTNPLTQTSETISVKSIPHTTIDEAEGRSLSREQKRKLKQLQKKKLVTKEREQLFEKLKENQLPEDKMKLLHSSAQIGNRFKEQQSKQLLERALLEKKANIPISVDLNQVNRYVNRLEKNKQRGFEQNVMDQLYYDQSEEEEEEEQATQPITQEIAIEQDNEEEESTVVEKKSTMIAVEEKKSSKPFMTLNFGTNSHVEEDNNNNNTNTVQESEEDNASSDKEEIEQDAMEEDDEESSNQNDDEELSWSEMVCKEFSMLIDWAEENIPNTVASKKELFVKLNHLLDVVLQEEEEESDSSDTKEVKNNTTMELQNKELISFMNKTDMDLIHDMLNAGQAATTTQVKMLKKPVIVHRNPEIEKQRQKLPIYAEEQRIMECIHDHSIIVLCGETGCGKTTQIPQFLFEAEYTKYGLIGVTQPRRVAAMSTAKRVSEELNEELGDLVGYQVRYSNAIHTSKTKIKFMTDGILMREIQQDFLLLKYSVIVLDEAHERNVNTDVLIGWLSRCLPQRNKMAQLQMKIPNTDTVIPPLKLIIMSATLRVDDFVSNPTLFPNVTIPVLEVPTRQYPVSIHFSKRTVIDMESMLRNIKKRVIKLHENLPQGGILVFLTGKQEIDTMVHELKEYMNQRRKSSLELYHDDNNYEQDKEEEDYEKEYFELSSEEEEEEETNLLTEQRRELKLAKNNMKRIDKRFVPFDLEIYPLYSMLSPQDQMKIFNFPQEKRRRLCVIATNVAETSITIPHIKYVVDGGRVKERVYEKSTGVYKYAVQWISKASANQRSGRAGRTGPGHCYRMYSSAVFDQKFEQFSQPDILKIPIDSIALQMKSMEINQIVKFPFPTPPSAEKLQESIHHLMNLGALKQSDTVEDGIITTVGKAMSTFPLLPRYSKMLLLAQKQSSFELLSYVIAVISILTVEHVFVNESGIHDALLQILFNEQSDLLAYLKLIGNYAYACMDAKNGNISMQEHVKFCQEYKVNEKSMMEIHKLRIQLHCMIQSKSSENSMELDDQEEEMLSLEQSMTVNAAMFIKLKQLQPPDQKQQIMIRQLICAGFIDQVACKATSSMIHELEATGVNTTITSMQMVPYTSITIGNNRVPLYIHPSSISTYKWRQQQQILKQSNNSLNANNLISLPQYIVYGELVKGKSGRIFMKHVTTIQPEWLIMFGNESMIHYSKPIDDCKYNSGKDQITSPVVPTFGAKSESSEGSGMIGWELPVHDIVYQGEDLILQVARLFLDGKLFSSMKQYKLIASPKELEQQSKKSNDLMQQLKSVIKDNKNIKKQLMEQFKQNPKFLLKEYLPWVKSEFHKAVSKEWPPK